jgi:electron transfer flavoprotein beta subunit
MKVIVCVEAAALGEAARSALALAVNVRSKDTSIIALAVTPRASTESLTAARRLGADRAVQVLDPGLDDTDVEALGQSLAQAIRRLGGDLVLAGARSDGEGRGIIPAAIAHHLGAPYLSHIEDLALEGREARVLVRTAGRKRRLAVPLPAVLTAGAALAPVAKPREGGEVSIETISIEARLDDTKPTRIFPLGSLDKPRRKPAAASSPAELVRRWRDGV